MAGFAIKASADPVRTIVRIGHFPNITHAQGVIGHARGVFEEKFGPDVEVDWKVFNAGPSSIEALFAGHLDIAYIGPSPAVNGFVKSSGEALVVIAGASSGGAAMVVRQDAGIEKTEDFRGKKIASPQLGNTQDVALRAWLAKNKLALTEVGGDVQVLPLANADQLTLFMKKEIDAAWTVEPWVSILRQQAGARLYLDEKSLWPGGQYSTTLVVVRKKFLEKNPDLVRQFIEAHVELTHWILEHRQEAKAVLRKEIEKETKREFPESIFNEAFERIEFTYEPLEASVLLQAEAAHAAGFLKEKPDLSGFFELGLLREVLADKKLEPLSQK